MGLAKLGKCFSALVAGFVVVVPAFGEVSSIARGRSHGLYSLANGIVSSGVLIPQISLASAVEVERGECCHGVNREGRCRNTAQLPTGDQTARRRCSVWLVQ